MLEIHIQIMILSITFFDEACEKKYISYETKKYFLGEKFSG